MESWVCALFLHTPSSYRYIGEYSHRPTIISVTHSESVHIWFLSQLSIWKLTSCQLLIYFCKIITTTPDRDRSDSFSGFSDVYNFNTSSCISCCFNASHDSSSSVLKPHSCLFPRSVLNGGILVTNKV